jgi:nitrogen regulatory protein PII
MTGRTIMKMLTIICREQLEDEVLAVFSNLKISGYTVVHGVGGSGDTGAVSVTHTSLERNKLILVALDEERMDLLLKGVKQLLARLVEERLGHPVALKAFVQPCEPVL